MKQKINLETKIKFLKKFRWEARAAFTNYQEPQARFIEPYKVNLVRLARKHLHYSDKTIAQDIFRGLKNAWETMR